MDLLKNAKFIQRNMEIFTDVINAPEHLTEAKKKG